MKMRTSLNLLIIGFYLVLIVAFFVFINFGSENVCESSSCVNICSENGNSSFFNETTNDFEVTHPTTNEVNTFQSSQTISPCESPQILPANLWRFTKVLKISRQKISEENFRFQHGAISVTHDNIFSFTTHNYCIRENENGENETTTDFEMMFCDENEKFHKYFHVSGEIEFEGIVGNV
jgi:hypothetical protein